MRLCPDNIHHDTALTLQGSQTTLTVSCKRQTAHLPPLAPASRLAASERRPVPSISLAHPDSRTQDLPAPGPAGRSSGGPRGCPGGRPAGPPPPAPEGPHLGLSWGKTGTSLWSPLTLCHRRRKETGKGVRLSSSTQGAGQSCTPTPPSTADPAPSGALGISGSWGGWGRGGGPAFCCFLCFS